MREYDKFGRPHWEDYFLALAFCAARRSIDPATKHGCIITNEDCRILSIGYNGPPKGADDNKVPLTRPEKYPFMAHAEANAIDNSNEPLEGGIAFVTGRPCSACLLRLIQNGIQAIYYGPVTFSNEDAENAISDKILAAMKSDRRPKMVRVQEGTFLQVISDAGEAAREAIDSNKKRFLKGKQSKKSNRTKTESA